MNKRGRRWVITAIVLVVVLVGGYFGYTRYVSAQRSKTATGAYQTAPAQRGNLVVSVAAAGSISAVKDVDLTFGVAGQVISVTVQAGDRIAAGQTLAALDTTDLEASLAKTQLQLATAQDQLKKLQDSATAADMASANAALASAQAKLDSVKAGPTAADIAAAEADLATAQSDYQTLVNGATAQDLSDAQLRVDQAKNSLWASQNGRDSACAKDKGPGCNSANAGVLNAEIGVQQAQAALDKLKQPATKATIQAAAAKVEQAKQKLADLKSSPTKADVAAAEAGLAQAQAALDKLTTGATTEDINIAKAQVSSAQVALDQAKKQLAAATLRAPFDGVALVVNATANHYVAADTAAIELADLSRLQVSAPLSELDVARVEPNQKVSLQMDALTGARIEGHVDRVAPAATVTQGVSNFNVTVIVDTQNPQIRPGMSANLTIVTQARQGVLLVPNRAIRVRGQEKVVGTLKSGQINWVVVQTGAANDSMTEIISGLAEKQLVVTNPPTLTTNTQRGGGAGGVIFRGGPGPGGD